MNKRADTQSKKVLSLVVSIFIILSIISPAANAYAATLQQALKPVQASGITYSMNSAVKELAKDFTIKDVDVVEDEKIQSLEAEAADIAQGSNSSNAVISNIPKIGSRQIELNTGAANIKSVKYPVGSRYMVLDDKNLNKLNPKVGSVYIQQDQKTHQYTAWKVVGDPVKEGTGVTKVPFVKPELKELFKSYKIPEQKLQLNEANVSYIANGVKVVKPITKAPIKKVANYSNVSNIPSQGHAQTASMVSNIPSQGYAQTASMVSAASSPVAAESFNKDGKKTVTLELAQKTLFEYPSESDKLSEQEKQKILEEERKKKEQEQGISEEDKEIEGSTDLRGQKDSESLYMKVWIDKGTITFTEPELELFMDFEWDQMFNSIGARVISECKADVTVKGTLKFNKTSEILLYGYDVEIPKGRLFVGIFLSFDVKGQVDVSVRAITTGIAEAGVKADFFYFIPYSVGPYAKFTPKSFDTAFSASGEISAMVAAVPQAGLILFDTDVLTLQFWAGIRAKAKFDISMGTGEAKEQPNKAEGSIDIDGFVEGKAFLIGYEIKLFNKDFNIYEGNWSVGEEVEAGEGEAKLVPMVINLYPNLLKNTIQARIWKYNPDNPNGMIGSDRIQTDETLVRDFYQGDGIKITIKHEDGTITKLPNEEGKTLATDAKGRLTVNYPLKPFDLVQVNLEKRAVGSLYKGITPQVNPIYPYDFSDLSADGFIDKINGNIMATAGGLQEYSGPVDIVVYDKQKRIKLSKRISAQNGQFITACNIVGGDVAVASIPYMGASFPRKDGVIGVSDKANLDSLNIMYKFTWHGQPDAYIDLKGTIQNTNGTKIYDGKVYYVVVKLVDPILGKDIGVPQSYETKAKSRPVIEVKKPNVPGALNNVKPNINIDINNNESRSGSGQNSDENSHSTQLGVGWLKKKEVDTSSSFTFDSVKSGDRVVAYIEHEGIKKVFYFVTPGKSEGVPAHEMDPGIYDLLHPGNPEEIINPADGIFDEFILNEDILNEDILNDEIFDMDIDILNEYESFR
jgi:hypothetical protein